MSNHALGPFVRIFLRYFSAALVAWGTLDSGTAQHFATDPDVFAVTVQLAGLLTAAATEGYYLVAKRNGWGT